ncbi:MAG: hypothetical protein ACRDXX_13855 [Stackebrandtia sp.]
MSFAEHTVRTTIGLRAGLLFAAAFLLAAGCEPSGDISDTPSGERLDAEVVVLESVSPQRERLHASVSDSPIDSEVAAGWTAAETEPAEPAEPAEPRDPDSVDLPEAEEGMSYVAVERGTDCDKAEDARLWRDGDDLHVEIVVPERDPDEVVNCEVPITAYVQFAVPTEAIEGVKTVDGAEPVDPTGPGELVEAVDVGPLFDDRAAAASAPPVELVESGDGDEIYDALDAAKDAENVGDAEAALQGLPDEGRRRFAFLVYGCPGDEPVLVVAPGVVSAELAGPGRGDCGEQSTYVVAVFDVDAEYVNDSTTPALYGQN